MAEVDTPPPGKVDPQAPAADALLLTELPRDTVAVVVSLAPSDARIGPDSMRRLAELGFLPGEHVRVVARGFPGGEPVAVRVGTATYGLRRFEAACIRVRLLAPSASAPAGERR